MCFWVHNQLCNIWKCCSTYRALFSRLWRWLLIMSRAQWTTENVGWVSLLLCDHGVTTSHLIDLQFHLSHFLIYWLFLFLWLNIIFLSLEVVLLEQFTLCNLFILDHIRAFMRILVSMCHAQLHQTIFTLDSINLCYCCLAWFNLTNFDLGCPFSISYFFLLLLCWTHSTVDMSVPCCILIHRFSDFNTCIADGT